ncbi:hypothetical protein KRP22_005602 [Phytophthora ramorum]|uniref:uncharacterized protein n=1 Tax=Phytophthora ramorum TaxID=164328 RepID=UPI0030B69EF5|nr:hypothetical protein KRP23_3497 [Phytophthora ramorum]KAH7508176.1 hypothetical protein KRP22_3266 [Phytophthora ramorum]
MRISCILLTAVTILFGSSNAARAQMDQAPIQKLASSGVVALSEAVYLDETDKRSLGSDAATDVDNKGNDEERAVKVDVKNVDDLVDSKKLDEALEDLTKMRSLFKSWNADTAVSKQVIHRLSSKNDVFVKYGRLVLMFNAYRRDLATRTAKLAQTVDELVDAKVLNAALKDEATRKALFKRWNADEAIALQVIERIASDRFIFAKYSALILNFNTYRTNPLRNAAKSRI